MLTNISELSKILKQNAYKVYRDSAPKKTDYPYIIYQYINDNPDYSSNTLTSQTKAYQISLITEGTEKELEPLILLFKQYKIYFNGFSGGPYKENDETITQFNCIVRFKNGI